ncbi:MAG: hypothetical protein JSR55_09875 [Proteobacteria bacterium]|nr:hypothetical protein [Pseudomonadota bacterium]
MDVLEHRPYALSHQRTADSLTFEAAWRALPRKGLVPDHAGLSLRGFKKLLPDMALIDIVTGTPASSRVALVGERIRERMPFPVVGHDYFHYVPATMRTTTELRLQTIVTQPCGLWQVLGIHYQQSLFKSLEITAFPLSRENGSPQLMILAVYSRGQVCDVPADLAMVSLDRATATAFLDIGAGVPAWHSNRDAA